MKKQRGQDRYVNLTKEGLRKALSEINPLVRCRAILRNKLTREQVAAAMADSSWSVRHATVKTQSLTDSQYLAALFSETQTQVRIAAIRKKQLDNAQITRLKREGAFHVMAELEGILTGGKTSS